MTQAVIVAALNSQPKAIDEHSSLRLNQHLDRLSEQGTYVPGRRLIRSNDQQHVRVNMDSAVLNAICDYLLKA